MRDISLVRQDENAEVVNINVGEVTIGRGPLLRCIDKRVSRNHGVINLSENGEVVLTSTHSNPIFYTGKEGSSLTIVAGNSVTINVGDEFALLPDSYRFRVTALSEVSQNGHRPNEYVGDDIKSKDTTDGVQIPEYKLLPVKLKEEPVDCENNVKSDELSAIDSNSSVQNTNSVKIKQEPVDRIGDYESKNVNMNDKVHNEAVVKKEPVCNVENNTFSFSTYNYKRNLPSWMTGLTTDITVKGKAKASTSKVKKPPQKRKDTVKQTRVPKKKEKVDKKTTPKINSNSRDSDNESGTSDKNGEEQQNKDFGGGKLHEMSDEDDGIEQTAGQDVETKSDNSGDDKVQLQDSADQTTAAGNQVATNSRKKQKCAYGANCYRKNPQHRADFSHPGDLDYEDKDLPECPFGKTCYRKNKQHRLDYKHTTSPRKAKKTQNNLPGVPVRITVDYIFPNGQQTNTGTGVNDDDDEEDDYDYDDPFLNDASSDDYQPTDSGSDFSADLTSGDEEGDTKRMVNEAKRFTRQKK